jgi:hypothetical protein
VKRRGENDPSGGVVRDELDGVTAKGIVEGDDGERVGADGLVDVLPLGTVRRPNSDLDGEKR